MKRATSRSLVFAMTGACAVPGGISTANLNVLHALADLARRRRVPLTVLSLLERAADRPAFLPDAVAFQGFEGRKAAYAARLLALAATRPLYCFDHVRLSLPMLPLAVAGAVRTVIFAHGEESWRDLRTTSRWAFQAATRCLTNSTYTLGRMRAAISSFDGRACLLGLSPQFPLAQEPPRRVPLAVELQAADGVTRSLGERVLLLVARMHPTEGRRKGHVQLIRVLPRILVDFPDVQLVFAGPGDDRFFLIGEAVRHGVAASVFFPGPVPLATLVDLYRGCYAFVMPSRQEGFGLAYVEAMACAKACVGCVGQGTEDVVVHGETGLLVRDPDDADELLDVLRRLLKDPEHTRELGLRGFARLHARFTARHHHERVTHAIGELLGGDAA